MQVPHQEARVLKDAQHQQHQRHAQAQVQLFTLRLPFDADSKKPAQGGIQQEQHHIPRSRPAEEHQREEKHGNILLSHAAQRRLAHQVQHQKKKHKQQAGKYHLVLPKE